MKEYTVAVQWLEAGEFKVQANNLEEAIALVEEHDELFPIGDADGEYVDCSFEVNKEVTKELN